MIETVGGLMSVTELANELPDIEKLRDISRSLAILEAIVSPDWESRYYSYDASWRSAEELASMRNGSGDEYSIVFSAAGAYIRGFDHESPMSPYKNRREAWPGLVEDVPDDFRQYVTEPAFSDGELPLITVCLWRYAGAGNPWRYGTFEEPQGYENSDGSSWMFRLVTDRSTMEYLRFARESHEVELDAAIVQYIYDMVPLTRDMMVLLNPDGSWDDVVQSAQEARYPIATQ